MNSNTFYEYFSNKLKKNYIEAKKTFKNDIEKLD